MADKLITPEFVVSFPNVWRPQAPMAGSAPGAKPKFGLTALFPFTLADAQLGAMKAMAQAAAIAKFGDKLKDPNFAKRLRSPFRDQGEKSFAGYVAGNVFVNFTSANKPGIVDANVDTILDESEFYAGCWAIASVNAFAYENMGNVGVAFGLNNVQKKREGEPLGGRSRPEEDFVAAGPVAGAAVGGQAGAGAGALFN